MFKIQLKNLGTVYLLVSIDKLDSQAQGLQLSHVTVSFKLVKTQKAEIFVLTTSMREMN